jgi:hypothetical protein
MTEDTQARTERHEASHVVIGTRLHFEPVAVTVEPGSASYGCAHMKAPPVPDAAIRAMNWSAPYLMWPALIREDLERRVCYNLAGKLGELMLAPPEGYQRQEETITEQAMEIAAALPATEADLQWAATVVHGPLETDTEKVAKLVRIAHRDDLAAGQRWLEFLEAMTRQMVLRYAPEIERLARVLEAEHILSGPAIAALLRDDHPDS